MNWSTVATAATVPAFPLPLPLPLPFAPALPLRRRRVRREPPGVGSEEGVLGASVSWRLAAEPPAAVGEHGSGDGPVHYPLVGATDTAPGPFCRLVSPTAISWYGKLLYLPAATS